MKKVKKFHENSAKSTSYSLFKEASKYAIEFGIVLQLNTYVNSEEEEQYADISRKLVQSRNNGNLNAILNSTWQGINFKSRIEDEHLVQGYFDWIKNWKGYLSDSSARWYNLR